MLAMQTDARGTPSNGSSFIHLNHVFTILWRSANSKKLESANVSLRFGLGYPGVLGLIFDSARIFHVMLLGSLHALGRPAIQPRKCVGICQ